MSFQNDDRLAWLKVGYEKHLKLNVVKRLPRLLEFLHKVSEAFVVVNALFQDHHIILLLCEFFVVHALKPIKSENFDKLRPAFVDDRSFKQQVFLHTFKFELFDEAGCENVGDVLVVVQHHESIERPETLAVINVKHCLLKGLVQDKVAHKTKENAYNN